MGKPGRVCPVPGCKKPLKGLRIVCGEHWYGVPETKRAHLLMLILSGASDSATVEILDYYRGWQ